jgi:hypothetical protein
MEQQAEEEKSTVYNNIENFYNLTGKYKSISQKYFTDKYQVLNSLIKSPS